MAILPLVFYLIALGAYAHHFASRHPQSGRVGTATLGAGVLAHTFIIGMSTMEVGHVPFAGTTQAISTFVWLLALAYLCTEVTTDERGMGVFVLPIIVLLQALPAVLGASPEPRSRILESPLFWVHVSSMLFSYASFGLAAVIGVTYMLQFKEIKAKHLGYFYTRLPSLQTLDVMNSRAVFIGWAFLTIGIAAGALWASQVAVALPDDQRLQAMRLGDPKIFVAVVTWMVYSWALVARRLGWRGRRSALLSAAGFTIVLLNLVPVSYFLTESHNFY